MAKHARSSSKVGIGEEAVEFEMTLEEVSLSLGVTRERVHQIEKSALRKVREYLVRCGYQRELCRVLADLPEEAASLDVIAVLAARSTEKGS